MFDINSHHMTIFRHDIDPDAIIVYDSSKVCSHNLKSFSCHD